MGAGAVFGDRGLTLVSRLACLLPLLATIGCMQSFRFEGRHARQVVAEYSTTGRLELASGGKRYLITPAQQAWLKIHSDTCSAPQGGRETDADCGTIEGRLVNARVTSERLLLPSHAPLRLDSIDELELIVNGENAPERDAAGRKVRGRPTQLWGVQLGGSGYAQVSFRWAFVKYLHLELGAFLIGPEIVANGSAGLVAELPFQNGWAPYIGGGGGGGMIAGPGQQEECGKPMEDCPALHDHVSTEFWYTRAGLAKYFTWGTQHRIGVDVGFWRGIWREGPPNRHESFLWPMAGLSYHRAF